MPEKAALVVGGTGFLGHALCGALLSCGRLVRVIARRCVPLSTHPNLVYHASPLDSTPTLSAVLPLCDVVFFLAADTTPATSARHPAIEADLNLSPALRFLDMLQKFPRARLIYISSGGTVYGNPPAMPTSEEQPLWPVSFHGAGKVAMEAFLHAYCQYYGTPVRVLRPSNVYGPGQSYRNNFGLIRKLLEHQLRNMPVQIWGNGSQVRDYLYIDDCIDACIKAANLTSEGFRVYNVGVGEGHSVNQVCDLVEAVTGKSMERLYRRGRRSDVNHILIDSTRIRNELDWNPTVGLEDGITQTWRWLQRQHND